MTETFPAEPEPVPSTPAVEVEPVDKTLVAPYQEPDELQGQDS